MNINKIKNTTKDFRDIEDLRQLPISIRFDLNEEKGEFDTFYKTRNVEDYLQRFMKVKVPISDREFGSPQEEICNIYMNLYKDKEINKIIETFLKRRKWIYHPVRKFEKWNTISKKYYNTQNDYWVLLLFNKILDPFTSLENLNMIRIPNIDIIPSLKVRWDFI